MSWVPSYVYTLSRFAMWRIDAYSARIPFAPSSRRASRAISVATLTLLRLASDTCCGVIVPASFNRPRCSETSCAFTISVSMSASRTCWIWKAPITLSNITRCCAYASASSKHAIAAPIAPHEMP